MDIQGWDERYRAQADAPEAPPTQLVVDTVRGLSPGRALDLACGTGRNALFLGKAGWTVRAIDGSATAVRVLQERARQQVLPVQAETADLQAPSFELPKAEWDLVLIAYYLQRDLLQRAKAAVRPGGVLLVIVHTTQGNEEPTASRLRPGELEPFFAGWDVLHRYEGKPLDPAHQRAVAEIVARCPGLQSVS